jgi:succinate-semialdehyde dehydrogenase/glutarate-semialdehyde dehydrogenase
MLVHESLFDDFRDRFVAAAKAVKVGEGTEKGTTMGPLANPRRIDAMERFMADAVKTGAKLETGGKRIGNKGNFFEPTVLTDVPLDARIMNEEPFGPVAIINRFSTLDDALAEANRLPYGLASYAYTRSAATAQAIHGGIEAGMVSINHHGLAFPEVPFGGVKDSGYGTEGGADALEAYLNTKFVTMAAV